MKVDAYLITCLTNMHAGVGGTNYDIIDNMVQRDVTTGMPTIFSSSLKGALREFFKNQWIDNKENENEKKEGLKKLNYIFGPDHARGKENESENEDQKKKNNTKKEGNIGHFNFFSADLLTLPEQAKDKAFNHTTSCFLKEHINYLKLQLGIDEDIIAKAFENLDVDEKSGKDFKRLAQKLPVIARNKLDNGQSENLFYEEVVPRETRFVFFVAKSEKYSDEFDNAFNKNVVQIGANGSVGYGFCEISKIS